MQRWIPVLLEFLQPMSHASLSKSWGTIERRCPTGCCGSYDQVVRDGGSGGLILPDEPHGPPDSFSVSTCGTTSVDESTRG